MVLKLSFGFGPIKKLVVSIVQSISGLSFGCDFNWLFIVKHHKKPYLRMKGRKLSNLGAQVIFK